jgi:AraC-like DNA-binding protein
MQIAIGSDRLQLKAWPPVLATRGAGARREMHSHHAMHFVLAMDGELRVRTSPQGRWSTAAGVLTSPDTAHAIDAHGVEMLVIFIDPESNAGAVFQSGLEGPARMVTAKERTELVHHADTRSFELAGADEWLRRAAKTLGLCPTDLQRVVHPGVRRLLAHLSSTGVEDDVSLDGLAHAVGLSPSRLMHAFTDSIGIPLRPYLSWLRVQRAACAILSGASLSDAAQAAGFADAAHMSRTFTRKMGIAPSALRPMRLVGGLDHEPTKQPT